MYCLQAHTSFNPEILQAGAVKGLMASNLALSLVVFTEITARKAWL